MPVKLGLKHTLRTTYDTRIRDGSDSNFQTSFTHSPCVRLVFCRPVSPSVPMLSRSAVTGDSVPYKEIRRPGNISV